MNRKHLAPMILLLFASLWMSMSMATAAPSAIGNWCAADPAGNAACASNVDKPTWLNPGYRWHVFFDTSGHNMCMQTSTNGGSSWTQHTCQFVGDNSAYEDSGDGHQFLQELCA